MHKVNRTGGIFTGRAPDGTEEVSELSVTRAGTSRR
jgi:hypothetical protein